MAAAKTFVFYLPLSPSIFFYLLLSLFVLLVYEVFDVDFHSEHAARIDEHLSEEHQHAAVYLTFGRHEEACSCHRRPEHEHQGGGYFLHHASPKADRMAVIVVRTTLIITDHLFLLSCVMAFKNLEFRFWKLEEVR